ncbi:hypothetical protein [Nocardia brasiliensis]|uniref:Secreted protein n=1 Tax=Nocardia brasiliensis (strain ATCC 700358 / HUJEG-1) TaxID=1133849 RepID=K0EWF9_NOCB7|nr:hypothetical protein [Nocardia brasiliensis]AFU04188.1 hypothetical protein O3I_031195 [Nocardia brasiliensis ATCC 700358]OCF91343.1 hypothetical protein AW168_06085 [Nocardia brasiliensis]
MSIGSLSRVLSCVFATAASLLLFAPAATADPGSPYLCLGPYLSSDGSANVESCIYAENGVPRAFGGLEIVKGGPITRDNCTMVVTVVDKDAYLDGTNEQVATSGPFPCLDGRYPSPPLTVDAALSKPGHRYVSFTEVTLNGQGIARIYSPELVL